MSAGTFASIDWRQVADQLGGRLVPHGGDICIDIPSEGGEWAGCRRFTCSDNVSEANMVEVIWAPATSVPIPDRGDRGGVAMAMAHRIHAMLDGRPPDYDFPAEVWP